MRQFLLQISTIAILMFPCIALASTELVSLDKTKVSFEVPDKWKLVQRKGSESAALFLCERDAIEVNGMNVSANFMVLLQKVDHQKIDKETFHKRALQMPSFSTIKEVPTTENLFQIPGKGVLGRYIDKRGLEHKVYVFDSLIEGDKGIIVVVDGLEKMFDTLDSEYQLILRSIKLGSQLVAEVKTNGCKEETPIVPIALLGTWQSMDDPFKAQVTYSRGGTFEGFVEDKGQVTWRYAGKWNLNGSKQHDIYTQSSLGSIPIGTEDDSEILSIQCGIMTYRSNSGKVKRYKKILD